MNEKQAIKILKEEKSLESDDRKIDAFLMGIEALEEIQQYRALGTVEELREARETIQAMKERNITSEIIMEYAKFEDECVQKGFTFKSLLEAREKQIPKKPIHSRYKIKDTGRLHHTIYCGVCGEYNQRVSMGDRYCRHCGSKIDWSE